MSRVRRVDDGGSRGRIRPGGRLLENADGIIEREGTCHGCVEKIRRERGAAIDAAHRAHLLLDALSAARLASVEARRQRAAELLPAWVEKIGLDELRRIAPETFEDTVGSPMPTTPGSRKERARATRYVRETLGAWEERALRMLGRDATVRRIVKETKERTARLCEALRAIRLEPGAHFFMSLPLGGALLEGSGTQLVPRAGETIFNLYGKADLDVEVMASYADDEAWLEHPPVGDLLQPLLQERVRALYAAAVLHRARRREEGRCVGTEDYIQLGPSCNLDEHGDPKPPKFVKATWPDHGPSVKCIGGKKGPLKGGTRKPG